MDIVFFFRLKPKEPLPSLPLSMKYFKMTKFCSFSTLLGLWSMKVQPSMEMDAPRFLPGFSLLLWKTNDFQFVFVRTSDEFVNRFSTRAYLIPFSICFNLPDIPSGDWSSLMFQMTDFLNPHPSPPSKTITLGFLSFTIRFMLRFFSNISSFNTVVFNFFAYTTYTSI